MWLRYSLHKKNIEFLNWLKGLARHQWLMPVMLATQEAEIMRIVV
jgi:hypothetical protein